jgi:hypothetical protein
MATRSTKSPFWTFENRPQDKRAFTQLWGSMRGRRLITRQAFQPEAPQPLTSGLLQRFTSSSSFTPVVSLSERSSCWSLATLRSCLSQLIPVEQHNPSLGLSYESQYTFAMKDRNCARNRLNQDSPQCLDDT